VTGDAQPTADDAAATADVPVSTASIAAGSASTCALTAASGVVCWGDNMVSELGVDNGLASAGPGDPTLDMSMTPVKVTDLASGVKAIFGGPVSFCAITGSDRVKCWGDTIYGQINGDPNAHANTFTPWDVGLSTDVATVGIGMYFDCAVTRTGRAKCWGLNSAGQLGTGGTDDAYSPADVLGIGPSLGIVGAVAGYFACAVTAAGGAVCWGSNSRGQLGTTNSGDAHKPAPVSGLGSGVTAIATGNEHACALLGDGSVQCWGSNASGQLGDRTQTDHATPAPVKGLDPAKAIAAAGQHSCALLQSGQVACWGDGGSQIATQPVVLGGFTSAVELVAGAAHACARLADKTVQCWGINDRGQLGGFDVPGKAP
jgi:alpha-tubulin suppressor-like RCC1 family protein